MVKPEAYFVGIC